ncbi:MAG: Kyphoscoliosis peptidase [Chitinophagaceae bacterium]|nr:Kyphoscoliosis peptidase [Chitinophagaceae bacterium]
MKHFILFFLLILTLSGAAQIPNPFHSNVDKLAKKFKKKYPDDSTRTVAIYNWIKGYLRYDLKAYKRYKFKVNSYPMSKVLYRRKALCYGFSKLFQDLCLRSGITCAQLSGYPFENPNDPYIHYYYDEHAWNAAVINGHWYLFDVTYDNGFVKKKKRVIRKFLNRTLAVPLLYDKTKFVHQSKDKFIFQSGGIFVETHYPILINGLLISDKVSIESFANKDIQIWGSYNASSYPRMVQLSDYAGTNQAMQLKIAADQSVLFNPKNNLIKAVNYYNGMVINKKIKDNFNKSDVDTVIKYAALFKRDNNLLHTRNIKRVGDEHKNLLDPLNKAFSHNTRLAVQFNKNGLKAIVKLAKTTEKNAINANKMEERQLKLEEHQAGSSKKYDTIPFTTHLGQYQATLKTSDSLLLVLTASNQLLDSLSLSAEESFGTLYSLLEKRMLFLKVHRTADMHLVTYPELRPVSTGIDSLTKLVDRYKAQVDKTENEYNKLRQQAIRTANTGYTLTSKEYIKIQTGIAVSKPFSKDSLVADLMNRTHAFKEALVNLYHHDEELLNSHTAQYLSAAKFLKKEKKVMLKTIGMREMAYHYRIKHEDSRYKAYDNLISGIGERMRLLKISYKRKTAGKTK